MTKFDRESEHWSEVKEVGHGLWQFRFMLWIVSHLPLKLIELCVAVITFFFYLGGKSIRERSKDYLCKVAKAKGVKPSFLGPYKHILSFALSMIEKLRGFKGSLKLNVVERQNDDLEALVEQLEHGQGAFLICSHLGNMEMLRSLTGYGEKHTRTDFKVFPVVDFSGTSRFNDLLRELNPQLMENIIDANSVGIDSAIWMKDQIAAGNLIVIAGDRTSANTRGRFLETEFMGEVAHFPEGAFILASILNAPIYFAFGIRKKDLDITSTYEMHIHRAQTSFDGSRKEKAAKVKELLAEYALLLQKKCMSHPYQWYNFYNFWSKEN
ncbi:MAG: lipid A biosynthesis acyltransferase [Fibrobacteraceae bacterium]|nr:lipid A biosynthesis acyltransferase [Fibrobacteraceae bacterium]